MGGVLKKNLRTIRSAVMRRSESSVANEERTEIGMQKKAVVIADPPSSQSSRAEAGGERQRSGDDNYKNGRS